MIKYKQIKINANMLINFCGNNASEDAQPKFCFDVQNTAVYGAVVQDTLLSEDCALFRQLAKVLNFENEISEAVESKSTVVTEKLLYRLVVVDFASAYKAFNRKKKDTEKATVLNNIKQLIECGFILKNGDTQTHFMPFDKSENMNRQSRITFIDNSIYDEINERLNLDIDFSKLEVNLSKYYAYRGLYLSTSKPVDLELNEETVVILNEQPLCRKPIKILSAKVKVDELKNNECEKYEFFKDTFAPKIKEPHDGQGFVCPEYAAIINNQLGENANSFQIRMPFAKGMLHNVDFHEFLSEFDGNDYNTSEPYMLYDAFGIKRDLKKAKILMSKSMLKCQEWLDKITKLTNEDPMKLYFDRVKKYGHKLFVANTDKPYGKTKTSRLSYQMINTLALDDEMFDALVKQHSGYISDPIEYLKFNDNYVADEENDGLPNWKKALFLNSDFASCPYIKQQLINTQNALLKQLAEGRLIVPGQMRYLARDLGGMLVSLLNAKEKRDKYSNKFEMSVLYQFFIPQGRDGANPLNLCYKEWYSFFRSPHLSRNEQCLLMPFIPSKKTEILSNEDYPINKEETYDTLVKYFGHLTGIVMVDNSSLVPMGLGGADFDGDLVNVVFDETVTKAVKEGVCDTMYRRKLPYIVVPSNKAIEETVPKYISFKSINDTFSNKIGLISNAAIGIGQKEYGKDASDAFDKDGITCAKCTILTGLEIDAAKHGKHPDLSIVEEKEFPCAFLDFKDSFDEMSKSAGFYMNSLESKIYKDNDGVEWYRLSIKDSDETINYPKNVTGTYINKLPQIFMENLKPTLPKYSNKFVKSCFAVNKKTQKSDKYKELINRCKSLLNFYDETVSLFSGKKFKETLNSAYRCRINLKRLLTIIYDENNVSEIYENDIPLVIGHLSGLISSCDDITKIEDAIKKENWHLQPENKKKECLKAILESVKKSGNKDDSIDIDAMLNGDEWNFLFVNRDQGYKLLWFVVHLRQREFIIAERVEQLKKHIKSSDKLLETYKKSIIEEIEVYNEKLFEKDEQTGYSIPEVITKMFYQQIFNLVNESEFNDDDKIKLLFNLTNTNARTKLARYFWESFSWGELKPFIENCKEEGKSC